MLDNGDRQGEIARWIFSLPCHVQFPPKLREELERTGAVPVPGDDVRRHRRIFCRGEKHRAALELRQIAALAPPPDRLAMRLYQRLLQGRLRLHPQRHPLSGRAAADGPAHRRAAPRGSGLVPPAGQELLCRRRGIRRPNRPTQPVEELTNMSGIPGNPAANLEELLQGLASLAEEAPVEPAIAPVVAARNPRGAGRRAAKTN